VEQTVLIFTLDEWMGDWSKGLKSLVMSHSGKPKRRFEDFLGLSVACRFERVPSEIADNDFRNLSTITPADLARPKHVVHTTTPNVIVPNSRSKSLDTSVSSPCLYIFTRFFGSVTVLQRMQSSVNLGEFVSTINFVGV
jgi:hypothetical protein